MCSPSEKKQQENVKSEREEVGDCAYVWSGAQPTSFKPIVCVGEKIYNERRGIIIIIVVYIVIF